MRNTAIIIILLVTSMLSCSQWKVNTLASKKFALLKNGEEAGQIQLIKDEYALSELSFRIEVQNGKIITADNSLKRLQILDSAGKPELILGSTGNIDKVKYKTASFNFSVIGSFTLDDDDNIYVQNRLGVKKSRYTNKGNTGFSPSYILVFNKKGELQYTMGKTGTPDIPFFYIERLFVDSRERLFVISRTFNTWELYRFNSKKRESYIDFSKLDFKEKDGKESYEGRIENMQIYNSGDNILLSVAYYHDIRFKYRKIYEYSMEKKKITRELATIPDPKNVLFNIVDDKIIQFWNIEGSEVKFMLLNTEGNVINNIKLKFDNKNYFSKIIYDKNGRIYSYHVNNDDVNILEWE